MLQAGISGVWPSFNETSGKETGRGKSKRHLRLDDKCLFAKFAVR